jgi:hypothetical protein
MKVILFNRRDMSPKTVKSVACIYLVPEEMSNKKKKKGKQNCPVMPEQLKPSSHCVTT